MSKQSGNKLKFVLDSGHKSLVLSVTYDVESDVLYVSSCRCLNFQETIIFLDMVSGFVKFHTRIFFSHDS